MIHAGVVNRFGLEALTVEIIHEEFRRLGFLLNKKFGKDYSENPALPFIPWKGQLSQ